MFSEWYPTEKPGNGLKVPSNFRENRIKSSADDEVFMHIFLDDGIIFVSIGFSC